jgi:hypothetical protein
MVEDDKYAPSDQKPRKILDSLGLTTKQENLGKQHGGNRVYHINTDQLISVLKSNKYDDLLQKISWNLRLTALQPLTSFTKNGEGSEESEAGEGESTEQKRNPAQTEGSPVFVKMSLNEKIQELKDFFIDQQQKGNKITYNNLIFNFDQVFIEKCKQENILTPLPDGTYNFGG